LENSPIRGKCVDSHHWELVQGQGVRGMNTERIVEDGGLRRGTKKREIVSMRRARMSQ
jgi:hypothetical protein